MTSPQLEIVIVSHGAAGLLRRCLESLRRHPASCPAQITVVDSGSIDGTPDLVEREFPEVRLLRRGNIGFSAANNVVLRETDADFILLLNPDTEVGEGAIDSSLRRMETDPSIGVVGCRLVTPSGKLDHACKRSFPTPLAAVAHFTGIGRISTADARLSQYRATGLGEHEAGEVDAINGAYMLVRREALRAVGPLDEGYWLYMEDLDWCRRFWGAGWKVFYDPSGTVVHVKGGSSGATPRTAPGGGLSSGDGPLLPALRRTRQPCPAQPGRLLRDRVQAFAGTAHLVRAAGCGTARR